MASILVTISLLFIDKTWALGTAFGYATGTTGGGSATPAVPSSNKELESWLGDSVPRVILLDKIYDFTGTRTTSTGCRPWGCSPTPQLAIDPTGWCEGYEASATPEMITYDAAGPVPIMVASNKTLLGKGTAGGIKGKGLRMQGSHNVIIQNLHIYELNPKYVWGGDAIAIDGASNIWIDHNRIQHVGRQMIVTGYGAATKTTISHNFFDGAGTYSATCNGRHYWLALFVGASDEITFALNYISHTSGRGPHVGGVTGYTQNIHIYNNHYVSVAGHALDPEVGSNILAEGNYMDTVTTPIQPIEGSVFFPLNPASAASCKSVLGRACVANTAVNSGSITIGGTGHLSAFADIIILKSSILAASAVPGHVQKNAGLGLIN